MSSTFARSAFRAGQHGAFRSAFQRAAGRRFQSTTAGEQPAQSWAKRMWDSPVGFKTVHFWAPVMKWGIVIAGVSDFFRPAEKLSLTQNGALMATGMIWTRWCMIIKPRNILLGAVNAFLGFVAFVQCCRIINYQRSQKGLPEKVEEVKADVKAEAKKVEEAVKSA